MILSRKIWFLTLGFFLTLMLSGCINENIPEEQQALENEMTVLSLHVRAVDAGNAQDESEVEERIKSLRLIMIDENDKVEINERFEDFKDIKPEFNQDIYSFFRIIKAGKKKIYLIANEESISEINDGSETGSFSDILSMTDGAALEVKLNSIYFSPTYSINDGKVYLPYTSFYELNLEGKERHSQPMYLIPVATKFNFNFVNYRKKDVNVDELAFSQINVAGYLMAHLKDDEKVKSYDDTDLNWQDWLAKVSEESWNYPGTTINGSFNEKVGWITGYSIPLNDNLKHYFVSDTDKSWLIPAGEDRNQAGSAKFGPFYFSESKNEMESDGEKVQFYSLDIKMSNKDEWDEDVNVAFSDLEMTNLKSLFRNTNAVINVNLYEGEIEIYAEIVPWNPVIFEGYLQEQ